MWCREMYNVQYPPCEAFNIWSLKHCLAHRKGSLSFFVSDLMSKYILVGNDWGCRKTNQKGTLNLRIAYNCFFSRPPRYLLNSVCLMTTNYVSISIGPPTQGTLVKSLHKIACITFPSLMACKVSFINMFAKRFTLLHQEPCLLKQKQYDQCVSLQNHRRLMYFPFLRLTKQLNPSWHKSCD